ncbi:MAG: MOSC domain-containing protein [Halobacteriales archaeon]
MAHLGGLRVFPVKGLDGIDLDRAAILEGGTLEHDREFALFDAEEEVLNGKRTDRVHDLRTAFDRASGTLVVDPPDGGVRRFDLDADRERAEAFFGEFFGLDLTMERDTSLGYVDRREMGPSVVSTATLRTVASWFDGMAVEGARRRLRANVEVSGVPAFWEDRFVGEDAPAFEVGDVRFEGVTPCGRCVVPQRDPDTGEPIEAFRERFLERRRESFPDWADEEAFDHLYSVMIITRIPEADRNGSLSVGDPVAVLD